MAAERPSGALETKEAEKTSTKIMAKAPEKQAVLAGGGSGSGTGVSNLVVLGVGYFS